MPDQLKMPPILGLCDLPVESLTAIFRLVDLASIKCLALTCGELNSLAQDFLFEHIDFHLNQSDDHPIDNDFILNPRLIGLEDDCDTLASAQVFSTRHKSSGFGRLLRRLDRVAEYSDSVFENNLDKIRSVKLSSAASTSTLAIHLLRLTSSTLKTLEIIRPRKMNFPGDCASIETI